MLPPKSGTGRYLEEAFHPLGYLGGELCKANVGTLLLPVQRPNL